MVARPDQVLALHINDYDLSLSRYHGAVIGLPKINLLATSPKDRRDYSPRPGSPFSVDGFLSTGEPPRAAPRTKNGRSL
jgi:hypothetical protein